MAATFSEVATLVRREVRAHWAAHDEIDMVHAPSECHTLVTQKFDRRIANLLALHGYTVASFIEELEARTSPKYAFFSEFGAIFEPVD